MFNYSTVFLFDKYDSGINGYCGLKYLGSSLLGARSIQPKIEKEMNSMIKNGQFFLETNLQVVLVFSIEFWVFLLQETLEETFLHIKFLEADLIFL